MREEKRTHRISSLKSSMGFVCPHQNDNTGILLRYFLWRLQEKRACGKGFFWILQVLLHILYPDSSSSHPDLVLLSRVCWTQQTTLTPVPPCLSCFCDTQQMVPPSSAFTWAFSCRRYFKFTSITAHVLGSSRIPSFPHYKEFLPQALDIVPENFYTLVFPYFHRAI